MFRLFSVVSAGLLSLSVAQIPCDDQFGAFCPEASGWSVGDCLKEHQSELPEPCTVFINVMDTCKSDIDEHCNGKEYSGEAISCLTDWTPAEKVSEGCLAALEAARPKKSSEKKEQSEEDRRKADKRRRIRRAAAKKAGKEF